MKLRVHAVFVYSDDPSAPVDDHLLKREVRDVIGMLDLGEGYPEGGPELRSLVAVRDGGFTVEQFVAFDKMVALKLQQRRARHLEQAERGLTYSQAVIDQCRQIERRWREAHAQFTELMVHAPRYTVTGLEENSRMRQAAEARARQQG